MPEKVGKHGGKMSALGVGNGGLKQQTMEEMVQHCRN